MKSSITKKLKKYAKNNECIEEYEINDVPRPHNRKQLVPFNSKFYGSILSDYATKMSNQVIT